jgi:flagellin-like hook-associated protein FlgL
VIKPTVAQVQVLKALGLTTQAKLPPCHPGNHRFRPEHPVRRFAQQAIQALDDAMQQIDSQRSQLGAVQNRFASTVANLQSISQNSSAAKGRVEDADFASEAAELTKQQTLQQASTAILSQANQLPSAVLKLLQ